MSLDNFEKEIIRHVKFVTGRKIKEAELCEWSTDKDSVVANLREGEELIALSGLGVYCAIKTKAAI